MMISTASDAQHQDLGAIEAAMKETARGRAFLANFARRVQQSDTLTMLAMLGRLERLSDELSSRIAELEAVNPPRAAHAAPVNSGMLPHAGALAPVDHAATDTMQRIDELASVLGNLHRHAVQLASQCAGVEGRTNSGASIEIDARAFTPPEPALLSPSQPVSGQDAADEEVLGSIAQALER
jgi:hypothetical protein